MNSSPIAIGYEQFYVKENEYESEQYAWHHV